ncbi:MAG: hypothetical protein ABI760_17705, partial [Ferruginibacter sp.]
TSIPVEKRKSLADKIRQAKVGNDKTFDATLGIPVFIYNRLLEGIAKDVENAVSIKEAVSKAVKYIKDNWKEVWGKFNESKIRDHFDNVAKGTTVLVAPFYDRSINKLSDAAAIRATKSYKAHHEMIHDVAEKMGIKITHISDTIGGFLNSEGTKITEVSNIIHINSYNIDKVEQFAAVIGAMTHEIQEATIAARYVEHGSPSENATEIQIKVSDVTGAMAALKEAGLDNFTLNEKSKTISLLYIHDFPEPDFNNKIHIFAASLDKKSITHETKHFAAESRYVDPEKRTAILKNAELQAEQRKGGSILRSLYQSALIRSQSRWANQSAGAGKERKDHSGDNANQEGKQRASGSGLLQPHVNNSLTTQDFFSNVVNGAKQPKKTWEPLIPFTKSIKKIHSIWSKFIAGFSNHIETSIPAFRDVQLKKIEAISNVYKDGGLVIDLGGSQGDFGKTITSLNPKIKSINLDMNDAMGASHNATPVDGAVWEKGAFREDVGGVKRFIPKEKADVVHESMMFQFISPDRIDFINEVADHYIKDDGVFIAEEKVNEDSSKWIANENKKDADFKSKYYTSEDITVKKEEVLVGMRGHQASEERLQEALASRFKYVEQYWDSGNFKGYLASNSKAKITAMLNAIGDTKTDFTTRDNLIKIKDGKLIQEPVIHEQKSLADKVRQAKSKPGKLFDASIGIPVSLWDTAVETVALAIEGMVFFYNLLAKCESDPGATILCR